MSVTIQITEHGLAISDADGVCIAHLTLISGPGHAALIMAVIGGDPVEVEMTREQVRRFEDVVHRVALEALFAGAGDSPRVPRAPHLPG
jgi:hypothetical protein